MTIRLFVLMLTALLALNGCTPVTIKSSEQHIQATVKPLGRSLAILKTAPLPRAPQSVKQADVFTVVVNDVPVKELLFAIARDASVDIDIADNVVGVVTLNAIDSTFHQILARISRQADIRYRFDKGVFFIEKDAEYLKHYDVAYVNISRTSESTIAISTEVASTGSATGSSAAGNTSLTSINNKSAHQFWQTTVANIRTILQENEPTETAEMDSTDMVEPALEQALPSRVLSSPESGIISVFATQQQHDVVEQYLDLALKGVQRQVFIEATIVEVDLNDDYQAGVDWSRLVQSGKNGFSFSQSLLGINLASSPVTTLSFSDVGNKYNVNATVKLLNQFGDAKVLSSPKLMVLNNQTALLKVVDNRVYFTVTVETDTSDTVVNKTFETEIHTVPVGLVMSVTPYVSPENMITLNVRPTISRILQFVKDPNPELANAGVESLIPEISVREIESMLRVKNGDVAVIGGLMQDTRRNSTDGIPVLSKTKFFGDLFSYKDNEVSKSELVIFLKPIVADKPSLDGEFAKYQQFLAGKKSNAAHKE